MNWIFCCMPLERSSVFLGMASTMSSRSHQRLARREATGALSPVSYTHLDVYKRQARFTEDFTTESEWKGPVTSFHVDFSKRDATGTVVAATINGTTNLTLKVQRSDGTLSFFPYELTRGL